MTGAAARRGIYDQDYASSKGVLHALNRVMRAVLDLDPMGRSARTVEAISVLRNDAFQPYQTGMPEKVRSNRA